MRALVPIFSIGLLFGLLLLASPLHGFRVPRQQVNPDELDPFRGLNESHSEIEHMRMVTFLPDGTVVTNNIEHVCRVEGPDRKALLRVFDEEGQPISFLLAVNPGGIEESRAWEFDATSGKTRAVPPNQLKNFFAESYWAYEDLLMGEHIDDDLTPLGTGKIDGVSTVTVQARPITDFRRRYSGYSRRVFHLRSADRQLIQIDMYDRDRVLAKSLRFSEFEMTDVAGETHELPKRMELKHHPSGTLSILVFQKSDYEKNVPKHLLSEETFRNWSEADEQELAALIN